MSVYAVAVYLHIVGALALFAALGLEWASLLNLRRAATAGQAREWARLFGAVRRVGGPAMLALLVTGIYMMATRWGEQPWIGLGFAALVLIAVLAPTLTGRRLRVIRGMLEAPSEPLPAALRARLRDRVLVVSASLRTTLSLGVVLIMSLKPGASGALTVLGVALVVGLMAALPAWSRSRTAQQA